ncbi:MAG: hypothetical protein HN403_02110 [Rhodospirillales bacterium]|jgi:hypothetical protein|nr:hypothetical protein [Rhodospirillales bacterium]
MPATSRIRWYPPLDSVKGRETELVLEAPILMGELLKRFCREDAALQRFIPAGMENGDVAGFMVLQGETLLRPTDTVEPGANLDILSAIDGG